jgi:hypothetical protein
MTRFKSLLAAAAATAIVAVVPASAQLNVHFVGAGSSAQFTMAAIATDQAAINLNTANGGGETVQHWTFKNGVSVNDNRDSRILGELGNIALVWLESSGTVTDIWATVSVDSTVGVRTFSAQETSGSGAQIQINQASGTAGGGLISPQILWPAPQLWPQSTPASRAAFTSTLDSLTSDPKMLSSPPRAPTPRSTPPPTRDWAT